MDSGKFEDKAEPRRLSDLIPGVIREIHNAREQSGLPQLFRTLWDYREYADASQRPDDLRLLAQPIKGLTLSLEDREVYIVLEDVISAGADGIVVNAEVFRDFGKKHSHIALKIHVPYLVEAISPGDGELDEDDTLRRVTALTEILVHQRLAEDNIKFVPLFLGSRLLTNPENTRERTSIIAMEYLNAERFDDFARRVAKTKEGLGSIFQVVRNVVAANIQLQGAGIYLQDHRPDNVFLFKREGVVEPNNVILIDFANAWVADSDDYFKAHGLSGPGISTVEMKIESVKLLGEGLFYLGSLLEEHSPPNVHVKAFRALVEDLRLGFRTAQSFLTELATLERLVSIIGWPSEHE